jgi:hypothetical protein
MRALLAGVGALTLALAVVVLTSRSGEAAAHAG